jgi:NAD(P)H-flavin reductase
MFERKIGDLLDFTGPFGAFTLDRPPEREMVFIAESTAIAPIRPMIRRALTQPAAHPLHLLYVAQNTEHLLYRTELELIAAAHQRFRFEPLVINAEHDSMYERLVDQVQRRWVLADEDRSRHFFVCGVGAGVLKLRDLLRRAGYERRAVRYEQW